MWPCTSILPGLPSRLAARFSPPVNRERAEIGQQLLQVEMGVEVEAVAVLLEALGREVEPAGHAEAVAKRRQLQQRQVERAAVEADQRRPAILFPAAPKMLGDDVRPELRLVEHRPGRAGESRPRPWPPPPRSAAETCRE